LATASTRNSLSVGGTCTIWGPQVCLACCPDSKCVHISASVN
jgi:hypothetical protein